MTSNFLAKPPLPVWKAEHGISLYFIRMAKSFFYIFWHAICPFQLQPEGPCDIPDPKVDISPEQLAQCQEIFNQQEERRNHIEQKAQWNFVLIVFLVPFIISFFMFLMRDTASDMIGRNFMFFALIAASVFSFFGFISILRAVSVQAREILFLNAVIDPDSGDFRTYKRAFQARGLLYCAAKNTVMNDHIAQFLKGAQIFTTLSVLALLIASAPAGIAFSNHVSSPSQTSIIGPVNIISPQLDAVQKQLAKLDVSLENLREDDLVRDQLQLMQNRIFQLEIEMNSFDHDRSGGSTDDTTP